MSFFSDLRAERLIAEIRGIGDPMHPDAQKAFQKLAKLGPTVIPIPGSSRPETITDSLRAAELSLSADELQAISRAAGVS